MKIQTNLTKVTPYFLFMQQVSDNINQIRASAQGTSIVPLQFANFQGQVNTLIEETVLEVTDFDGSENLNRVISPTLRSQG